MLDRMLQKILVRFASSQAVRVPPIHKRRLAIEQLLPRLAFTAEGQAYSFDQIFESSAIGGAISGTVQWGDGTSSPATVGTLPATGPLSIRFDYSLDASNFFASQERKNTLQSAANAIVSKFSDQLSAIRPTGSDQWSAIYMNPATGAQSAANNLTIAANEILVYVGARTLGPNELGRGEKGGFTASSTSQAFLDAVRARGQAGATLTKPTDVGPWGGTIAFSSTTNWHFGATTVGLDSNEADFATVVSHELMHILGFGVSDSWNVKVSGGFTGANSVAVSGLSPVPLNDVSHWKSGLKVDGRSVIMEPSTEIGVRKLPTRLDFAGLQDIGWQLLTPQVRASASHTYGDNATFPATLQLNGAVFGSVTFPLNATITNAPPVLSPRTSQSATQNLPLSIAKIGQFTDPGFGAAQATPPLTETFTYSINWGDSTPVSSGSALIESLGSPGVNTRGSFDGQHTYTKLGSYVVTMSITDDDGGSSQQQFTINVGPPPVLTLSLDKASIPEDAGANAATLTIQRSGFDLALPLTVTLSSSDTTEATLPASVIIPATQSSITVPVQAIDDTLLDGTIRVTFSAVANTIASNPVVIDVLDREKVTVSLNRTTIAENAGAGAATLTVNRSNTDNSQDLIVQLSSSDTTEAVVPATVTILAGTSSINVGVNAVDDNLFDGTQIVILSGSANGYVSSNAQLSVTDYEPLSLVLQANELNEEDPTRRSTQAQLSIRSPAPAGGLTLQLTPSEVNQLVLPATVTIAAGLQSISFAVSAIDDTIPQGRRTLQINATGAGVTPTSVDIVITDNDPALWTNPNNPLDVNNSGGPDPLDVLIIINEINLHGTRLLDPIKDLGLPFVDTNRNGQIDPLDVLGVINELNRR